MPGAHVASPGGSPSNGTSSAPHDDAEDLVALPPAAPVNNLMWPNDALTQGQVVRRRDGALMFEPDRPHEPPFSDRKQFNAAQPHCTHRLHVQLLDQDPTERLFVPALPILFCADDLEQGRIGQGLMTYAGTFTSPEQASSPTVPLEAFQLTTDDLEKIVGVAGGIEPDGLDQQQTALLRLLFSHHVDAISPDCAEPQAARQLARLLATPAHVVTLHTFADEHQGQEPMATFNPERFRQDMHRLGAGEHQLIEFEQFSGPHDAADTVAHAMAIVVTKQGDGLLRVGFINAAGWRAPQDADTPTRHLALARTVSVDDAATAMEALLAGQYTRPAHISLDTWRVPGQGFPLLAMMCSLGHPNQPLNADFHGHGLPLTSTPQKADDCAVETTFAAMSIVLNPADYKLAKAACLNGLAHLGKLLDPDETDFTLQSACERLEDRATSSLSASMIRPLP